MVQLTEEEIKQIELDILLKIDQICRANHIDYSLCGGTLLGAVRHKGFIPWDDDIDITMTRQNYVKFVNCFNEAPIDGLRLINSKYKNYGYMFSKICDSSTKLVEHHNKKVEELGVYVDLFPVDYLGNSLEESKKKMASFRLRKYLLACWNWKSFYVNKSKSGKRQLIRFIVFVLSRFVSKKRIIKSMNKRLSALNQKTRYSGCFFGSYDDKDIFDSKLFEELCDIEFEGHSFLCFKRYDDYLKQLYGDYMSLPPIEKRVTHHTFDAYKLVKEDTN